ncbi:MAG TPA: Nramp family divalent metal transporter [Pirellulaceae bacterium]|nr:Nramp family divalent metal transporter [Pirellulaceae bacterium]
MSSSPAVPSEQHISGDVIPAGTLPPLKERQLPEPVPLRRMIGPSIILAGLALGSGEFILWPLITLKSGFVFFWACILAVVMQYFLNMEIMRWTLATGESAVAGFVRLSRTWAWVFLLLNVLPWTIPGWAKGAAQILSWLIWSPQFDAAGKLLAGPYDTPLAIAGMFLCGIILTAGPVVYETVEKVQMALVGLIVVSVIVIAAALLIQRPDALTAQWTGIITLGAPQFVPQIDDTLTSMTLLGALAFAGAGGTMNLAQSNYIKEKGYGMGSHLGRITSPLTGKEEPITEIGYHFAHDETNLARWRAWWRGAGLEHFFSFLCTCLICLFLLTLISYIVFYDASGKPTVNPAQYREGIGFVWPEAEAIARLVGTPVKYLFLVMGVAILFTTEFGVLDAASRISTDLVKITWLRDNPRWSEARLYFLFLWGEILLGSGILLLERFGLNTGARALLVTTAAMNGVVMFLYGMVLVYRNRVGLPPALRIPLWRLLILLATIVFFGTFTLWAARDLARSFWGG